MFPQPALKHHVQTASIAALGDAPLPHSYALQAARISCSPSNSAAALRTAAWPSAASRATAGTRPGWTAAARLAPPAAGCEFWGTFQGSTAHAGGPNIVELRPAPPDTSPAGPFLCFIAPPAYAHAHACGVHQRLSHQHMRSLCCSDSAYWQCQPPQSPPRPPQPPARSPPSPPPSPPRPPASSCQKEVDDWAQCGGSTGSCSSLLDPSASFCKDTAWPDRCCRAGSSCKRR